MPLTNATVNATMAAVNMRVAVLLAATSLSTPTFNQTGIKISAPPIASVAPTMPAKKPAVKNIQTLSLST